MCRLLLVFPEAIWWSRLENLSPSPGPLHIAMNAPLTSLMQELRNLPACGLLQRFCRSHLPTRWLCTSPYQHGNLSLYTMQRMSLLCIVLVLGCREMIWRRGWWTGQLTMSSIVDRKSNVIPSGPGAEPILIILSASSTCLREIRSVTGPV